MAEPARKHWTTDEFFAWQEEQEDRYELVNGEPVRMMAGARNAHDDVVVNVLLSLGEQLRGSGCRPFTGDGSVETYSGQIRRPDIGVDCGDRDPDGYGASDPRVIVEVLSPSTRDFDAFRKIEEYKLVESVRAILLIDPNRRDAQLWLREGGGRWSAARHNDPNGTIDLGTLGLRLAMDAIYEGINTDSGPPLMPGE